MAEFLEQPHVDAGSEDEFILCDSDDGSEESTGSISSEEDAELLEIKKQIELAAKEKREREEKLKAQQEQLAKIQHEQERAMHEKAKNAKREKSAKKKREMLQQLEDLQKETKNLEREETDTHQIKVKMEALALHDEPNSVRKQKKKAATQKDYLEVTDVKSKKKNQPKRSSKSCTKSKKQKALMALLQKHETELQLLKERLMDTSEDSESNSSSEVDYRVQKDPRSSKSSLKDSAFYDMKPNSRTKLQTTSKKRKGKKSHHSSTTSSSQSSESESSGDEVSENLKRLLAKEKERAMKLEDQKLKEKSLIQKKIEELEKLQKNNEKEASKLKSTVLATDVIDAEIEAEKTTQQQKLLESMARAEEEQKKRLSQQKEKDIWMIEMKHKLEELKKDNRERLDETIKTASVTKLLEESIDCERLDAEKMKLRRKEIGQLMRLIKKAQVVDLCFLVDATGSMGGYIREVKDSIKKLVRELAAKHESLQLNLAFVAYRDHCDAGKSYGQFDVLDFTRSVEDFTSFVGTVQADGGGDGPEDIFGGFQKVLSLSWTAPTTRVVMHVADAPCHGSRFHSMHDDYASGDPHGYTAEDLLPRLQNQANIFTFMFFKLNNHTDKMISEFQAILGSNSDWLKVYPLTEMNVLMDAVSHTISASIATVESTTMSSFLSGRATTSKKEFTLDSQYPDTESWHSFQPKKYQCDYFELPTLDTVTKSKVTAALNVPFVKKSRVGSIKIAPNPFAKGALRIAYHALNQKQGDSATVYSEPCVVKDYIEMKVRENALKKHLTELDTQAVASFLARCFNKIKPRGAKEIFFLETEVLKMEEPEVFLSKEPWISGDYKKFNNNWGWVDEADYSASIQAFSHWTFDASEGSLIVVDLQGKKSSSTFLLTDPVIHSKDLLRFGRTNLGPTGVTKFFKTHACNDVCKALGILSHKDQAPGKEAPKSSTVLC